MFLIFPFCSSRCGSSRVHPRGALWGEDLHPVETAQWDQWSHHAVRGKAAPWAVSLVTVPFCWLQPEVGGHLLSAEHEGEWDTITDSVEGKCRAYCCAVMLAPVTKRMGMLCMGGILCLFSKGLRTQEAGLSWHSQADPGLASSSYDLSIILAWCPAYPHPSLGFQKSPNVTLPWGTWFSSFNISLGTRPTLLSTMWCCPRMSRTLNQRWSRSYPGGKDSKANTM